MFDTIYWIIIYGLAFIGFCFLVAVSIIAKYLNEETYDQAQIKEMTTEAELFEYNKKNGNND